MTTPTDQKTLRDEFAMAALTWREIDSAPKDGTEVLVLIGGDVVHHAYYDGPSDGAIYAGRPSVYNWFSLSSGCTHHDRLVTHWMPMPPTHDVGSTDAIADAMLKARAGKP